jgi:hypothetical protein
MSKRKKPRQQKRGLTRRRTSKKTVAVLLVLISLLCVGTIAAPWKGSSGVQKLRAFLNSPPPPVPPPSNPSKEYIYAGGKLIATEEPVALVAPTNLNAVTDSSLITPRVTISWNATSGADHYVVERKSNVNGSYTTLSDNEPTTSYTDNSVSSVTAYLYRVKAVDSNNNTSPYSNLDLATAISFTDDTLNPQLTLVKAAHITELRQAVDAIRSTANLGAVNWGGSVTQYSTEIQATYIQDLRTNLNAALNALSFQPCSYTDNSLELLRQSYIKMDHINELRQCVK